MKIKHIREKGSLNEAMRRDCGRDKNINAAAIFVVKSIYIIFRGTLSLAIFLSYAFLLPPIKMLKTETFFMFPSSPGSYHHRSNVVTKFDYLDEISQTTRLFHAITALLCVFKKSDRLDAIEPQDQQYH